LTVTERSSTAAAAAEEPKLPPPTAATRSRRLRREYLLFLLFIAPNAVLLAVFAYWPIIFNGYLSLTSWDMLSPTIPFVGLANYGDMFSDPDFWAVIGRTLLFSGAVVVGCLILGMAVALLLNDKLFGRNIVRTASFAPHILSGVAMGTVWLFIFDPQIGLMKVVLEKVGIAGPAWMTDSKWALWGLVIVYLWKNIGFVAIVYLAGLQGLPADYYEAAKIDGANAWTLFRRITLPLLSPVTFFVAVVTIVGTFQAFDVIAIMTDGGPGGATTTISWYIYNQAFRALDAGHAGAGAIVMFVILIAITAAQTTLMERRVHYR
jgi:sn-glycerol 3-phosphate transport system permease protein